MTAHDLLLAALLTVQAQVTVPKYRSSCGICKHVRCELRSLRSKHAEADVQAIADQLMLRWPEYSGDCNYPVPDPCAGDASSDDQPYLTASRLYGTTVSTDMWNPDHPYGAARLRLLSWMIEQRTRGEFLS